MNFTRDTSFVTASFYPASFYPSSAEAAAFQIPATQLSQSGTRMGVDCLNARQALHKGMPFTAVMCIIAIIAAIFTTILEFPVLWRTSWLAICIAFVVLAFVGGVFCLASTESPNSGDYRLQRR
ncbi:MAG TPA: hypothetical protein VGX93_02270 [Chthoniobacterales bacterium]|jgi:hypothetical protein|nr:hypothetical protein [Chthoniobacterales bacterium]